MFRDYSANCPVSLQSCKWVGNCHRFGKLSLDYSVFQLHANTDALSSTVDWCLNLNIRNAMLLCPKIFYFSQEFTVIETAKFMSTHYEYIQKQKWIQHDIRSRNWSKSMLSCWYTEFVETLRFFDENLSTAQYRQPCFFALMKLKFLLATGKKFKSPTDPILNLKRISNVKSVYKYAFRNV